MRTITKNPSDVVPNLLECDRYKSLIVIGISRSFDNVREVACIFNTPRNCLNWFGDRLTSEGYEWFWESEPETTLVDFIIRSWTTWTRSCHHLEIYILEDLPEVITTLDKLGVPLGALRENIISKCPQSWRK